MSSQRDICSVLRDQLLIDSNKAHVRLLEVREAVLQEQHEMRGVLLKLAGRKKSLTFPDVMLSELNITRFISTHRINKSAMAGVGGHIARHVPRKEGRAQARRRRCGKVELT